MNIDREVSIMKKVISKSLKTFLMSFSFLALVGCSANTKTVVEQTTQGADDKTEVVEVNNNKVELPAGKYNEGVVLVKKTDFDKNMLGELQYKHVEQLYKNSPWQKVELNNKDKTFEAVEYLSSLNVFDKVEYDYIMGSDGTIESIDVSGNPNSSEQGYLDAQGIFDGWGYQMANSMTPGGSPDVVVAVIDTGVDYNHIDLRDNIWTNSGEIPNNGIDDDGNGYVDDIHGWDCVGNDKDPMDDNGHGTHVAGIIAAENNTIGTVGVAFNCKIMCLKAGNSTGYFNNSDIAEAVQYAYMNGASVINMSFGGSSISTAVKEALEDAYNQCILVAAAGNNGLCNQPHCPQHEPIGLTGPSYPAILPFVIGVMSTNSNGSRISSFSNFDHFPYNSNEYETFACGEQIPSTWPNNKIARLSGTSMASPVVAGIAALLRSRYQDRDVYSNKFIQSQIVNTSEALIDGFHGFANVYEALTKLPKPSLSLFNYYIFDNESISNKNDGDGIIDSGETIRIGIEVSNRGGVASNVHAAIDSIRNNDPSITDPYFVFNKATIQLSDVGTYSVRDCGLVYDENDNVVALNDYFEITVSEDCPNSYLTNFNVNLYYENGLDENDHTHYCAEGKIQELISKGIDLPSTFTEDTVLDSSSIYIVSHDVIIPEGVTVNFGPGTEIQFYSKSNDFYDSTLYSPQIKTYGTLNFNGTKENNIYIHPCDTFSNYYCLIWNANFYYCNVENLGSEISPNYCGVNNYEHHYKYNAYNSTFILNNSADDEWGSNNLYLIYGGKAQSSYGTTLEFDTFDDSYLRTTNYAGDGVGSYVNINNANRSYFDVRFGAGHYVTNMEITNAIDNVFVSERTGMSNMNAPVIRFLSSNKNNVFMTKNNSRIVGDCFEIQGIQSSNTLLDSFYRNKEIVIKNYFDSNGNQTVDLDDASEVDLSKVWPYVKSVKLFDKEGNTIKKVGRERFDIEIEFNTEMDTSKQPAVGFGTVYPYDDYRIDGDYIDSLHWKGTYSIKAFIENGTQYLNVKNAYSTAGKENITCKGYYNFDIDTTNAMSMDLTAYSSNSGIHLEWAQDDYDTLMGYNIYRSTSKDGNYVKLNSSVVPAGENTFIDNNAEPGITYWYTFTVVFSDMTESAPAGKVSCTAADTIAPSIYHTPVNQGYLNNNLVISCTASDNIGIQSVTLYYRTKGQNEWKPLAMLKQNDRYSATIFGSDLSLEGLEYYIVASDGVNTINKGSAENPYSVIIKDASAISQLGDVDGDGVITTKDALMIMQSINGDLLLTDDQFRRADLNKDNVLSSVEALRILQYINGNVPTLEM